MSRHNLNQAPGKGLNPVAATQLQLQPQRQRAIISAKRSDDGQSASDAFPLPETVEHITSEWLTRAFRTNVPDVIVEHSEIEQINHGSNTMIWMKLGLNEAGRRAGIPETVVIKAGFEPHSREIWMVQANAREIRGYRDVIPALNLPAPECYYADTDTEHQRSILIMEDLEARGVALCHASKPQTHEQVARRLTELARYHAQTWASPEIGPTGKWGDLEVLLEILEPFAVHYSSPDIWQRSISTPHGCAVSTRFHDRLWAKEAWNRLTNFARQLPHCILHGDPHLGNMYIDPDGTPGFFDTVTSTGPAMLEVSYHVSTSLDLADRARYEAPLIQHYLDELVRAGVDAPTFDEAMHQYGVFLYYGFFMLLATEAAMQEESMLTINTARAGVAMLDHDTIRLINSLKVG
ncbi:MAG: phosphotransferase [Novosphingobium sp.]|nr:phosphotransferase [Novosphingobium sp.]